VAELRWLLLLFGIGIIAAVYVYTRYQPRISGRVRNLAFRKEPTIGSTDAGAGPSSADDSAPEPDPIPSEKPVIQELKKVVAIRLMAKDTKGFMAEQLILSLRELGLRHGCFGIFHRLEEDADKEGGTVFSVASLTEPGSFDLTQIKTKRYPGISIFLTLPGPCGGVRSFEAMMDTARALAQRLDGYLLDEQGGTLSIQRERYMREEIIQFEHQESV